MTTVAQAFAAVRSRIEAAYTALPLRWPNESNDDLPHRPAAFVYVEFHSDAAEIVAFGGGRGDALHRVPARLQAYVMTPAGEGLAVALGHAETLAAVLRGWRDADVSFTTATVFPGGRDADDGNYFVATVIAEFTYDQTG